MVDGNQSAAPPWENVELVRRRSGGGTVFHDEGNVNYSVICPTANFTRDKHADMVTMAIREVNQRARVNERHDIVLDQGGVLDERDWPDTADMHRTMFHPNSEENPPLKVSGSAYKITRHRSLHHGTCLLASADLPKISQYLQSPARPFIRARGVESVRSQIGNVHSEPKKSSQRFNKSFQMEVFKKFAELYKIRRPPHMSLVRKGLRSTRDGERATGYIGKILEKVGEVQEGIEELRSSKWLYGQTPQFTLSSHFNEEDERERPPLPKDFPPSARVYLKIKSGVIDSSRISVSSDEDSANAEIEMFNQVLKGKSIHDIDDFNDVLNRVELGASTEVSSVSRWLNTMFGKPSGLL
ncbi:MAG: Biotin/lipoate A/B protein ligase [Alectoria sarmentosa]|nr:MAG: Biotin/lipoate A/B protein ligase [Alectoria sarmentosa]